MTLTTVNAPYGVTVTVTGPLTHLCPFVPDVDVGTCTLTWVTGGRTIEAHSLAAYLRGFEHVKISHEDLARQIAADLADIGGVDAVSVSVAFATAGFAIEARA